MGITSSAWCLAYSRCSINGGQGIEPRSPALGYTKGAKEQLEIPPQAPKAARCPPPTPAGG